MNATDPSALRFRRATPADIGALAALVESAYRGDASRVGWTTEADLLEGQRIDDAMLATLVDRDDGIVLIAERDDRLTACCELQRQGDAAYFGMFSVRPTEQGRGIGDAVLAEAERIARDGWQVARVEMTVIDVRDELIAWYQRRGYQRTGVHKPFPYGDPRYGIPQRNDLRFEILRKPLR